ncbi:MAG TPA: DUF2304 domain-containing protein [Actinobacteria bacterium]|nr:DUF2304 domain-containing protein [Actinomycetota bacterium]
MTPAALVLLFVIAFGALGAVLWLVRRGRLKERFALLWLGIGAGMVVLIVVRPLLDRVSELLGIKSGTTTLFLLAFLVILGILLQLSVTVTALEDRVRDLAEAIALERASVLDEPGSPIEPANEGEHGPSVGVEDAVDEA